MIRTTSNEYFTLYRFKTEAMSIQSAVKELLAQLTSTIGPLPEMIYCTAIQQLSGASIGQHVRHSLDMFVCLQNGLETGFVNYEKRERNPAIERSAHAAIESIDSIAHSLELLNRDLVLESGPFGPAGSHQLIMTNYFRELLYNLEHLVHHMALIRIGIESSTAMVLPSDFGVAASTLRYREAVATSADSFK